jgi:hypothetical protein
MRLVSRILPLILGLALAGSLGLRAADLASVQAQLQHAVDRVKEIVNQPVPGYPVGPDDHPAMFQPGWFHAGANTPDFAHVDIRASQECGTYSKWSYVTSDLNPGVMFAGSSLEFNAMTKLFYTDRSLPKKKLSEEEMEEINGLYRTIGDRLAELRELQASGQAAVGAGTPEGVPAELAAAARPAPPSSPEPARAEEFSLLTVRNGVAGGLLLLLLLGWVWERRRAA